jgi:hypothetical protein
MAKEVVLMRRILLLLMTVAAMVATMAASAAATKPVVEEPPVPIEDTAVVANCGDFQVRDEFVFTFTAKEFYDENGELIMVVEQIRGTDTFINSGTPSIRFTSRFQNTEHIDPAADTDAVTGVISLLTVPGSGAVLLDVGRIVFEGGDVTFEAGPHQVVGGDVAGLCEALAPKEE